MYLLRTDSRFGLVAVLADVTSRDDMDARHRLWINVQDWAAELGFTIADVISQISSPLDDRSAQSIGREISR